VKSGKVQPQLRGEGKGNEVDLFRWKKEKRPRLFKGRMGKPFGGGKKGKRKNIYKEDTWMRPLSGPQEGGSSPSGGKKKGGGGLAKGKGPVSSLEKGRKKKRRPRSPPANA